mgnify:CR=1 FL=1
MRKPPLVAVDRMARVGDLDVPRELYTVLTTPACLAGMPRPTEDTPWRALREAGFHHVVCLTDACPPYNPAPLNLLHAVLLQDLYGGIEPHDPERERREIGCAAQAVLAALERGEGVGVHCAGGTGRTGTLLGVVLRSLGHAAPDVVAYLDAVHKERGKDGWPESAWQSELLAAEHRLR